jgi:acyl-CoA reductase-like NAD-dependent aldehyde dehydrogenase
MAGVDERIDPQAPDPDRKQAVRGHLDGRDDVAGDIVVENPATGEEIARVPDLGADDVVRLARQGPRRAARLGGARLRGPRARAAARAEVAREHREPGDRDDRRRDRQDLRGRAARRDQLHGVGVRFWAKNAPEYLADEKVKTARS